MTPRFQNCQSLPLENYSFTQKLQDRVGFSILNHNFSEITFVVEIGRVGIAKINSSSNLVCAFLAHEDIGSS
jgi:hypothetical protein